MSSDPRLMALPALRKRAEEQARETRAMLVDLADRHDPVPWEGTLAQANLTLISDLSRPASRDAVARLVAEALGLRIYATAPTLRRHLYTRGARWELGDGDLRCMWHGVPTDHPSASNYIYAPDIAAAGDADEALTLIALAVLGGAS